MAIRSKSTAVSFVSTASVAHCVGRGKTSPEAEDSPLASDADGLGDTVRAQLFDRFSLLRSTAFRMGITFWLLFTLCFGVAQYGFYKTLEGRVLGRIDDLISSYMDKARDVYATNGLDAVIHLSEERSSSPMTSSMGFYLSSSEGDRIAGNVPYCLTQPGWDVLTGDDLGLDNDNDRYRFFTADIGGNVLSVGKSLKDLIEFRKVAFFHLMWSMVLTTIFAIGAAWLFARRIHRRTSGIAHALEGVAAGNLQARLPVSCASDDIDKLARTINSSLDRLAQTVDGMRQVSTDIAHDLKTPLNRLYITIEEAAAKSRAGQCVGEELDSALDEAQGINGTFEALLRIAQIEAGARRSQFARFDLVEVLDTAAEVYAPVIEEQNQSLKVAFDTSQSLPMLGDKSLVLQLIVNLIENAVHHCDACSSITLSAGEEEGVVWCRVADNGPGIPEAERTRVFQRLYRLQRSRTTKGTGLGLSLVKAIADLHCGTVLLSDNEPGLVVTVRFDRHCPAS